MKISYRWLNDYIDLKDISAEELKDRLTFAGIEVEAVSVIGEALDQVIVAKIEDRQPHPDSDHLSVCQVNDGENILQVVCGAHNCAAGQKIVFAPIGASLGDFKIKKAKLRGVESSGMICSERELGLSENHDGIMILPEDAPLGKKISEYLSGKDTVYDVEITPNRPDLLGMIGVARDLSSLLNLELKTPELPVYPLTPIPAENLQLVNKNAEKCPRYIARMIEGVEVKESPEWLKQKLTAIGLRPINNIVDITNFVLMEYGHPLHAFDYELVRGKTIIVRDAVEGEQFEALNDKTYTLVQDDLVIADAERPIALAGVMGGANSQISSTTKNVVIEAACFKYSTIRRTSNRHKLFSDSSYRFERGMSDETTDLVSRRAVQLILELAGGRLVEGCLDNYPQPVESRVVALRPSRVKKVLTINLDNNTLISYLRNLGLTFLRGDADSLYFTIPSWRNDLTREIDLIEEIIRLHGYNNVETVLVPQTVMNRESIFGRRALSDRMVNLGFFEAVNLTYFDPELLQILKLQPEDDRNALVRIMNPMGPSFSALRSTLIPGLFKNVNLNLNHNQKNIRLFELNKVFTRKNTKLAKEEYRLTGIITGMFKALNWYDKTVPVNIYDLKGIVESILSVGGLKKFTYQATREAFYQESFGLDIVAENKILGSFGKVDPKILIEAEIDQETYLFDLNVDLLLETGEKSKVQFAELPKYPFVQRDISFVIDNTYSAAEISKTIKVTGKDSIKKITVIDEFKGKQIKEGFRSLAISFVLGSEIKTLTDEYVNSLIDSIISELKKKYNIEMR